MEYLVNKETGELEIEKKNLDESPNGSKIFSPKFITNEKKFTENFVEKIGQIIMEIDENDSFLKKSPFKRALKELNKLKEKFYDNSKLKQILQILLFLNCEAEIALLRKELDVRMKMTTVWVGFECFYLFKKIQAFFVENV